MVSEEHNIPSINGLVLAGGKSIRMGRAKDLMNWHGKEQRYFVADLLAPFCDEVFISCRKDQLDNFDRDAYTALADTFLNMGPFGGILSALSFRSDKAWLVVACDLPLLEENSIKHLVSNRDPKKVATTYESPFNALPEPLVTIWEPKSYPILLNFLEVGSPCPREVLIKSDTNILKLQDSDALMNVNTPEDFKEAKQLLKKKMKIE